MVKRNPTRANSLVELVILLARRWVVRGLSLGTLKEEAR